MDKCFDKRNIKGRGLKQYTCNFIIRGAKFKMGNCPSAYLKKCAMKEI
jgi:hypothetical protein